MRHAATPPARATRATGALMTVAVVAAALASCASGPADSSDSTASNVGIWTESDPGIAAALAEAGHEGPLTMATDLAVGLPWAATEEDGTTPQGMDIDLALALGELMGVEMKIDNTSFDTLIPGLVADRYDLSISAMIDNTERQEQVDFVDFVYAGSGFLGAADSDIDQLTLADICGLSIAVARGTVEETYVTEQSASCEADGSAVVDIQVFQTMQQSILALQAGRVDAVLGENIQNGYLATDPASGLVVLSDTIGESPVGIAFPKDSTLVEVVRAALQHLIDTGVYMEIMTKWGAESGAINEATVNEAIS